MNPDDIDRLAGALQSGVAATALIIGGFWAFSRFVWQREGYPHVEFTADVNFIGHHAGFWIVELVAFVENKGRARHRFSNLTFDLDVLRRDDPLEVSDKYMGQAVFPMSLEHGLVWLPDSRYYFIEPGVKAKYSYVARIPSEAQFVMLHVHFSYLTHFSFLTNKESHTAERTIAIPASGLLTSVNCPLHAPQL